MKIYYTVCTLEELCCFIPNSGIRNSLAGFWTPHLAIAQTRRKRQNGRHLTNQNQWSVVISADIDDLVILPENTEFRDHRDDITVVDVKKYKHEDLIKSKDDEKKGIFMQIEGIEKLVVESEYIEAFEADEKLQYSENQIDVWNNCARIVYELLNMNNLPSGKVVCRIIVNGYVFVEMRS